MIEIKGNEVIKTLDHRAPFTKEEFNLYRIFSADKNYCVKLYKWNDNYSYSMEKINILCNLEESLHSRINYNVPLEKLEETLITYIKIFTDCVEFSKKNLPNGKYFMHRDLNLSNVVYTENYDIKLIDVDAFEITDRLIPARWLGRLAEMSLCIDERLVDLRNV
tara:strand:+ start:158 stop:649 length:492 start_codon:yes stop_codon:yes gene_type:complete